MNRRLSQLIHLSLNVRQIVYPFRLKIGLDKFNSRYCYDNSQPLPRLCDDTKFRFIICSCQKIPLIVSQQILDYYVCNCKFVQIM
jgi:hypothetical protein